MKEYVTLFRTQSANEAKMNMISEVFQNSAEAEAFADVIRHNFGAVAQTTPAQSGNGYVVVCQSVPNQLISANYRPESNSYLVANWKYEGARAGHVRQQYNQSGSTLSASRLNNSISQIRWFEILFYVLMGLLSLSFLVLGFVVPLSYLVTVPIMVFCFFVPWMIRKNISDQVYAKDTEIETLKWQLNQTESEFHAFKNKVKSLPEREQLQQEVNLDNEILSLTVPYMTGEVYEAYVGTRLLLKGWADVDFTPVTGDFGADILATDPNGNKVCIQCKRYSESVGIQAVQEVFSAKEYYKCDRAMVCASNTFTSAAQEMASRTGVELLTIE